MTIFTQASLSCMRLACKSRSNENGVAMACCGLQMRSTVLHKTETVSFPSPPQVRLGHWPEWRDWPLGSLHSTTALTVHVHVACACLVWLLLLIQLRPRGIGMETLVRPRASNPLHFAVQQKGIVARPGDRLCPSFPLSHLYPTYSTSSSRLPTDRT